MDYAPIIGFAAGAMTTLSFVPQVIRTFKTKRANDISGAMLLFLSTGVLLWFVHGVMVRSAPIIAANFFTLLLLLMIAGLKTYYGWASRRKGSRPAAAAEY